MEATIQNFGKVSDRLYRGGCPSTEQIAELKELGVNVIVALSETGKAQIDAAMEAGILTVGYEDLAEGLPEGKLLPLIQRQASTFFLLTMNPNNTVFVHCADGLGRTLSVVAAYRMLVDGWTNHAAMVEANEIGLSPDEAIIRQFIERFDARRYR